MNDWVDDIADRLDGLDETRREFQRLRRQNAEVIRIKAPARWSELDAAIEKSVARWMEKAEGKRERAVEFHRESDIRIAVRKSFFPQMRLNVELDLPGEAIRYSYQVQESVGGDVQQLPQEPLSFVVDPNNEVYIVHQRKVMSADETAKLLLLSVFNACS
ncbi:MAG TPA: hypothetical protein VLM38_10185 [Blastocatellia bacterium]|nr:hypothetical protein [Blastocatellia bacterium]